MGRRCHKGCHLGDIFDSGGNIVLMVYLGFFWSVRASPSITKPTALNPKPQTTIDPKPQNPKAPKPQNPKTPKPQNPKTLNPKLCNLELYYFRRKGGIKALWRLVDAWRSVRTLPWSHHGCGMYICIYMRIVGCILGLYRENGRENGNYSVTRYILGGPPTQQ